MIIIKPLNCKNVKALVYMASEVFENRDYKRHEFDSVVFVAKYELAKEIIYELAQLDYRHYRLVFADNFGAPEWDGYEDEYLISLNDDGVWVEPAKRKNKYVTVEGLAIFVLDDCNSKIISHLESDVIYEVKINDEEDCDCDCDGDCEMCDGTCDCISSCNDGDCSISYKVNGKIVDKETFTKTIKKMDNIYLDNIQDMLLRYSKLQKEMDKWRKMIYW